MKEIRFSDHAQLKMEVLARHQVPIDPDFVKETVRSRKRCGAISRMRCGAISPERLYSYFN